jgi:hypothetical protein
MNPRYRSAIFLGMLLALIVPYLGFTIYYSLQFPSGHGPSWFTNTILIWFTANFLIGTFLFPRLMRRIFSNQVVDPEKSRVFLQNVVRYSTRLVILWVGLFLYGLIETIRGKVPIERAIPAGIFLLFFIGFTGWGLYRAKRATS